MAGATVPTMSRPVSPSAILPPDESLDLRRVPFTVIDQAVHLLDTPSHERVPWLGPEFTEYVLRFGAPSGITDRDLRHAVEQSPELDGYEGWVKAEARRGDASDIGNAAKALAEFDATHLTARISCPTAVVVTIRDNLVRSRRQRDHNAWLVMPEEWASALDEGIKAVTAASPGASGDPVLRGEDRPMAEARAAHG